MSALTIIQNKKWDLLPQYIPTDGPRNILHYIAMFDINGESISILENFFTKEQLLSMIYQLDDNQNTPIHYSAKFNTIEILKFFVKFGTLKIKENGEGLLPEEIAKTNWLNIYKQHFPITSRKNPNLITKENKQHFNIFKKNNQYSTIDIYDFVENMQEELLEYVKNCDWGMVRYFFDLYGVNYLFKCKGLNLLQIVCLYDKNGEGYELIREYFGQIDCFLGSEDEEGNSIFHLLAKNPSSFPILKLLPKSKTNIKQNYQKQSPIDIAKSNNLNIEWIQYYENNILLNEFEKTLNVVEGSIYNNEWVIFEENITRLDEKTVIDGNNLLHLVCRYDETCEGIRILEKYFTNEQMINMFMEKKDGNGVFHYAAHNNLNFGMLDFIVRFMRENNIEVRIEENDFGEYPDDIARYDENEEWILAINSYNLR